MQPSKNNILHFIYKSTRFFKIPDFQRPYTWDTPIVAAFLEDLERVRDSSRNHYFGTVVYVPEGEHFTVIDGQQRLTTTLLLLVAMYHILDKAPEKSSIITADQIKNQYLYDRYGAPDKDRKILLRTVTTDNEVFKKIFEKQSLTKDEAANRQKKTYDQFMHYFSQRNQLENYINALEKFEIITVAIDKNDDNPQLIFESINSTGKPLSSGDKIRNYSLMLNNEEARCHVYDRYWQRIERSLTRCEGDELVDDITGFYRSFLQCKMPVAGKSLPEAKTYSYFKEFFNEAVDRNHDIAQLDAYYEDLLHYLDAYLFVAHGDDPHSRFADFAKYNARLQYLKFSSRISFLMDMLVHYVSGLVLAQEVISIYQTLEVFVVRRLICNMGTNGLNNMLPFWFRQIESIRDKNSKKPSRDDVFRRFILDGRGRTRVFPNDAEVRSAIENFPMGTYANHLIMYFLVGIEDAIQPKESGLLAQISTGEVKLSIEHIMPQTLSTTWKREIGANAEAIHETWLNRLANLTLTGYNATYSNKPFSEKKNCENGFVSSPLNINRHVASHEVWGQTALQERQKWLITHILRAWPALTSSLLSNDDSRLERYAINDDIDISNTKPIRVTICGTEFSVSSWRQFAETVCRQLFQLESDVFISFLDDPDFALRGGGRQVSGNKDDLRAPHEIVPGSGIFVGLRYSAQSLRDFIYKIAEKYKLEDDIFYELER
jgi:hypothetical protein